jgi:hypothetical protein
MAAAGREGTRDLQPLSAEYSVRDLMARAAPASVEWLGERAADARQWLRNLVRFLPARVARLVVTLQGGLLGVLLFAPGGLRAWRRGGQAEVQPWLHSRQQQGSIRLVQLLLQVLDLFGVPEVFALVWRGLTRTSRLTAEEVAAATAVLGPHALRYEDVRIAKGGILNFVFRLNGNRAFAVFHTINLPATGRHTRDHLDIVLHELVHVCQYERAGSRYFAEALLAQRREGYGYGGAEGLHLAHSHGRRLRDFNREQQAQIVQDYFVHLDEDRTAYEPYIGELRQGKI